MLGLFGSLNLGARSLQTQQLGIEIAGHNLANVNNPAYARQRLQLQTSQTIPDAVGPQGTGAEASAIQQVRDPLIDKQLANEISVSGYLESAQKALQYAQANLGQQVDRQATGAEGAAAASGIGGQNGIAEYLNELFSSFQSLSTNPTSLAERQVLLLNAQSLTTQFNQVDERLNGLRDALNDSVTDDVGKVNGLLSEIAHLNDKIINAENVSPGAANDLRDTRLQRVEELAKYTAIQTSQQPNGAINVSIDGNLVVQDKSVVDRIEAYDNGANQTMLRLQTSGIELNPSSGTIAGSIRARDQDIVGLQNDLNEVAALLITEVNAVHQTGFGLNGTSGEPFFNGTNAADISVNEALINDPGRLQAAGETGAVGDNQVILQLAQLSSKKHAGLSGQTFGQAYAQSVTGLGQSLNVLNDQLNNQSIVETMIRRQRDSISGVSLDEEMTEMVKYQRAYQASARLISTIDQMLETLMSLKR